MEKQMLGLFSHINEQTVGQYEQQTGTVTMFYLLPAEAKVTLCKSLLKKPGKTLQAIVIIDYLRTLSEERKDYKAWGENKKLEAAYSRAKNRVGILKSVKVVEKKTV
ncbi:hypothetical protein CN918_25880 [Priestia megaterium]|nr:hypothetical protein CN918_25880 [Priestia megaterium]